MSCGRGVQRRVVHCHGGTPKAAEEAECDPAGRPPPQRDCHLPECPTHHWAAGEWQAVSGVPPFALPRGHVTCALKRAARDDAGDLRGHRLLLEGWSFGVATRACQKKKKGQETLMRAGWKGELRNISRGLIYFLVQPGAWLGPMQILSRFWVGWIWVCSRRLSPAVLLQL